jgi:hypothetical protein
MVMNKSGKWVFSFLIISLIFVLNSPNVQAAGNTRVYFDPNRVEPMNYDLTNLAPDFKSVNGIPIFFGLNGNDGRYYISYCIQPGINYANVNSNLTEAYPELSHEKLQKINLILAKGYSGSYTDLTAQENSVLRPPGFDTDAYIATQVAIWEVVLGQDSKIGDRKSVV